MFKFIVFVPESHLEQVKDAMFEAGAGHIGAYDRCAWQMKGLGQFRPLPGSAPHVGEQGRVERVEEYRVELVCPTDRLQAVAAALRAAHPYETPAYEVIRLEEL